MIQSTDFTKWLRILLAEAFGVADTADAYFLDSGTSGLLGTIDTLSASQASAAPTAEQGTIASHSGHVLFLLQLFDAYEHGQTPAADWEASWATRVVDEAGWQALRDDLRAAYGAVIADVQANDAWPEPRLAAAMTLLAHCSYHVGEIRQRLLWVAA